MKCANLYQQSGSSNLIDRKLEMGMAYIQHGTGQQELIDFRGQKCVSESSKLRGIYSLSGEATLSKLFCLPSETGSTLKGKNLLPLEVCKENKQEVTKLSPLLEKRSKKLQ